MISLLMFLSMAEAKIDCRIHKVYCHIKSIAPKTDNAMVLSNLIARSARRHRVPARLLTAIFMQESSLKLGAKNCKTGLDSAFNKVRICRDFGIGQIYWKTAEAFGFDIVRLTTDLAYSVEAGAIVLADFKRRYSSKEIHFWARYNAGTKHGPSSRVYKRYVRLVSRYLNYEFRFKD